MIIKYYAIFILISIINLNICLATIPNNILEKINAINESYTSLNLANMDISDLMLKEIINELEIKNKTIYLKSLDLSKNQLKHLPADLGKMGNLTELILHSNQIQDIPPQMGNLNQLEHLDLSENQLENLPPEIGKLSNLIYLHLFTNKLRTLPPQIGNLIQLRDINISENQLQNIPSQLGNLRELKILYLERNQLQNIPSEMGNLSQVETINLSENKLQTIPPTIGNLNKLLELHIEKNQLQNIPLEIGNLRKLQILNLTENQLQNIPSTIGKLSKLKSLHLDNNQLQIIPPQIGELRKLEVLNLYSNNLQYIPLELSLLSNLKELNIDKNPLRTVDPDLKKLFIKLNLIDSYKSLFYIKNDKNSHIVLSDVPSQNLSVNKVCYDQVRKIILKIMEQVWPSLSENKKSVILKNKKCNSLLREESEEYPQFKVLSQSFIPEILESFSKESFDHFLYLCQEDINQDNYFRLFKESLNEPLYGPLFAGYLRGNPLVNNICGPINMTFTSIENPKRFFIPEIDELAKPFTEKSSFPNDNNFKFLNESISDNYVHLFAKYRSGSISSKFKKGLSGDISLLAPYNDESSTDVFVWRKANSSFENIDFKNLKEGQIYTEPAPTCTSTNEFVSWEKNSGLIRIKLPPDLKVARLLENISQFTHENEVILPPNSCFQHVASVQDSKTKEKTYDFILVPWTKNTDYGCYSRKLALQEANKYYGRKYKINGSAEKIQIGTYQVNRPNHGLTHGARQAYMALDLIKFLSDNEQKFGELGSWANKIRGDEKKQEIIFLMALHFRAARLGETENYFPEYVAHMEKILKKSQLETNLDEIKSYANLLSEKPILDSNDKKFMMMVLDVSHRTDHLRQTFWNVEESEKDQKWALGSSGFQNEENQKKIIDFMQARAEVYLEATGAYNVKKFGQDTSFTKTKTIGSNTFSDPDLFAELENNPAKLYQVMQDKMLK